MRIAHLKTIVSLAACGLLALVAGRAAAQSVNVTFDEYGNGFLNGSPLPFVSSSQDPLSLQSTLMYQLPFPVVRGDLVLTDGSIVPPVTGDVIRFDTNSSGAGVAYFFSDLPESGEIPVPLADVGIPPPTPFPGVTMPELGPEGNNGATYLAGIGSPGSAFFGGNLVPVTYTIISDGTAVPEPSAFVLLGAGILLTVGIGWLKRKPTPLPKLADTCL